MDEQLEIFWDFSLKFKIQQKKNEWIGFVKDLLNFGEINHALEIGCYDGGTTIFLGNICKNLITIDQPNPARFDTFRYYIDDPNLYGTKLLNTKTNFNYISGNSHKQETIDNVRKILGDNKLDLLFIDGDHSYDGVKMDFEMYSTLVRPGGIIAFHDVHESSFHETHNCYVHNYWKEIKEIYKTNKTFYCGEGSNSVWGGIGLIIKE